MQHRLTLVTLFVAAASAAFVARAQTCIEVVVENVRPQQGYLMLAAFARPEDFGKKPVASLRVPAGEARMSVQMCGLSGSEVALTLFQDVDGDGKMSRNLLGVPSEPWGASGSPGSFGPQWDTTRVALDGKAVLVRMSQ
ncbi:MAG: DUF2141 domain-containing protein [Rubrivivax sp.]|nr:DUF2141 domain-containing protein [Rubrivivax sp.]